MSKDIVDKLRSDEHYYGKFGKQYLSNSDIATLLKDPLSLGQPSKPSPAFLVGGYFHTSILEPDKLKKYKIIPSTTRNTKVYKEMSDGDLCLLQHEVDQIQLLSDKIMNNKVCRDLIQGDNIIYEEPGIKELEGNMWKGKADIINKNERLVIDLKTTNDITMFKRSANKYNYDSQAFIYSEIFGYELIFIVIDKNTRQIGLYDCSADFINRGYDKVKRASEAYDLFYKTENFDATQHFTNNTL